MLELRPTCENCNAELPPDSTDAMICSFECTFCRPCVENILNNVCPHCGGDFCPRPIRPKFDWKAGDLRNIELGQTLTAREGWWTQARPCPTTPTLGHRHRNDGRAPNDRMDANRRGSVRDLLRRVLPEFYRGFERVPAEYWRRESESNRKLNFHYSVTTTPPPEAYRLITVERQ